MVTLAGMKGIERAVKGGETMKEEEVENEKEPKYLVHANDIPESGAVFHSHGGTSINPRYP